MTHKPNPKHPALAGPDDSSYDVGYRKPPTISRFKPGQSGNSKGRPRGARNKLPALNEERLKDIIIAVAYRDIKVSDGKKQVSISMAQAVMRSIAVAAAKGSYRSQKLFAELLAETERANKQCADDWLHTAIEYKIDWEAEFERCKHLGIVPPAPIPHPDDIVIDMKTGTVVVRGPFTKEEKEKWDHLSRRLDDSVASIAEVGRMLRKTRSPVMRRGLEEDIAHERKIRDIIRPTIGDWQKRVRARGG